MFPRDFWRSGRWHALTTGDPGSDFYFLQAPYISSLTGTTATITAQLSAPCQLYLQWALTAGALGTGAGFTNAPGEESFTYATHVQSMTGLANATEYVYRVIATDALGHVLTSAASSFQTAGTQPPPTEPGTVGPRYGLYGAGATGGPKGFPTFPSGAGVHVVPNSIGTSNAQALADWIDGLGDNVTVVLDRSQNGEDSTAYGAGTFYDFSATGAHFSVPGNGVRAGLTIWGYNAKMRFANGQHSPPGLLSFEGGGWDDLHIYGLDICAHGNDPGPDMRTNGATEDQPAIFITSWKDLEVMDVYAHHCSELVYLAAAALGGIHYRWPSGYDDGAEIAYCEGYASMNQGMHQAQGWGTNFHHNKVWGSRQVLFDLEENNYNPGGSAARRIVDFTIADCVFADWNYDPGNNGGAISFEQADGRLDAYENVQILRNEFRNGPQGGNNPSVDPGSTGSTSVINRPGLALLAPPGWQTNVCPHTTSMTINGNVSYFPADQLALDGTARVWGGVANCDSLTVIGNDFQGLDLRVHSSVGSVTWSGNNGDQVAY